MKARLEGSGREALLGYRALAPFAEKNHLTDEHLLVPTTENAIAGTANADCPGKWN